MALDVLVAEEEPAADPGPSRPRRRVRIWIVLIVVLSLVGAAVGLVTRNEVATNTQFDRTHRSLTITQAHIATVVADLATVRSELNAVDVQVFLATKALAADQANLKTALTELANAQSDVSHQTTLITDLQTCLGGVQQALNALSVADQARAIDALNSVAPSCNDTVASGG